MARPCFAYSCEYPECPVQFRTMKWSRLRKICWRWEMDIFRFLKGL